MKKGKKEKKIWTEARKTIYKDPVKGPALRKKISESRKGSKHSKESKEKISIKNKGRVLAQENKDRISKSLKVWALTHDNSFKNKTHSEESREKMREKRKNCKRVICEYCGKEVAISHYFQWHGERCKYK